ncbi:MAG: hypothetical protein ACPGED_05250 [Flavobacteriales bacterium]
MTIDKNIELNKYQSEIEEYIGLGKNSLVYNYEDINNRVSLHLITINPRHNQSFLFHISEGVDRVSATKNMLEYVQAYKDRDSSFTIQWKLNNESTLHTSYFSAKNILSALDKLYYDRDPNSITVFSVIMNPVA